MPVEYWDEIVFSQKVYKSISKECRKKTADEELAGEAKNHVLYELSKNEWERCKKFNGASSPETFLYKVVDRMIIDFIRKKEGRKRPPEWIKKNGKLWIDIYNQICLARKLVKEFISEKEKKEGLDPVIVRQNINIVKKKYPWCGMSTNPILRHVDDNVIDNVPDHENNPETQFSNSQYERAAMIFHLMIEDSDHEKMELTDDTLSNIENILKELKITPEERLILKLHTIDSLSFKAIGRKLGLPEHKPGRMAKELFERAKPILISSGIEFPREVLL